MNSIPTQERAYQERRDMGIGAAKAQIQAGPITESLVKIKEELDSLRAAHERLFKAIGPVVRCEPCPPDIDNPVPQPIRSSMFDELGVVLEKIKLMRTDVNGVTDRVEL